jgi:hypothetical protein
MAEHIYDNPGSIIISIELKGLVHCLTEEADVEIKVIEKRRNRTKSAGTKGIITLLVWSGFPTICCLLIICSKVSHMYVYSLSTKGAKMEQT